MILIKVIALLVSLTALTKTYMDYKKRQETLTMFLFWIITWMVVMIFTLWPNLYFEIENYFEGFGIGVGTFLGLIIIFLLFITYRVYIKAHRLERQVRDIIIKFGLLEIDNTRHK